MTCILTLDISTKYNLNISDSYVEIGSFEQNITGTTASLKKGEVYNIQQLLYGLMLPSGNDASLAIAVWVGKILLTKRKDLFNETFKKKDCVDKFVCEMNMKANSLNMEKTRFANPHGLSNSENRSCAYDLAVLC